MSFKINNRMKWLLLILGLTFAVTTFLKEPESTTNVVAASTMNNRHSRKHTNGAQEPAQDIALEQLHRSRKVADTSDLFRTKSWYVPPPQPHAPPPPVPVAPPLPFSFLGKVKKPDGKVTIFISDKDRVYLVHGGETLNNNYHVDGIENGKLALTYLPMKKKQYIELSGEQ